MAAPELRPSGPDDLEPLRAFLQSTFNVAEPPFLDRRLLYWKYWQPRTDYPGPRSFVLDQDGAIVGHAGVWPRAFRSSGNIVHTVNVIDWAAAKGHPGAGVRLMAHAMSLDAVTFSIGGTDVTRAILPSLGFAVPSVTKFGVRRLWPSLESLTSVRGIKSAARFARDLYRAAYPRLPQTGWLARLLPPEDVRESTPSGRSLVTPAFAAYMSSCPTVTHLWYTLEAQGQSRGVLGISYPKNEARIFHLDLDSDSESDWISALSAAVRVARKKPGAELVLASAIRGPALQALYGCGFRPSYEAPVFVCSDVPDLQNLDFQMGDNDGSFLYD